MSPPVPCVWWLSWVVAEAAAFPGDPPPVHPRLQGRSPSRFQHKNSTGDVEEAQAGTSTSELEMAVADAKRLLDSNDWRERSAALRQLCDIRDQLRLLPDTEISLLLDSITFRLSDGNVKVRAPASTCLGGISFR